MMKRKEDVKNAVEVMQAYLEGKQIQCHYRDSIDPNWVDLVTKPNWNWNAYDYRVAPSDQESSEKISREKMSKADNIIEELSSRIEVMKAYKNGASIQWRLNTKEKGDWNNFENKHRYSGPSWDWSTFEYRIAPKLYTLEEARDVLINELKKANCNISANTLEKLAL